MTQISQQYVTTLIKLNPTSVFAKVGYGVSALTVTLNAHSLMRDYLRRLFFSKSSLDERTVRFLEPLGHQFE